MCRYACLSLLFVFLILADSAYAEDDLMKRAQTIFKPVPTSPPALDGNPITGNRFNRQTASMSSKVNDFRDIFTAVQTDVARTGCSRKN